MNFVDELEGDYDVLFLNSISAGPLRPDRKRVNIRSREVQNLQRFGTPRFRFPWAKSRSKPRKVVMRSITLDRAAFGGRFYSHRDWEIIRVMNLADHVVFQSAYMEPIFRKAGYRGRKFSVIHNGADSTLFHPRGRVEWDGRSKLQVLSATFAERVTKRFDLIAKLSEDPRVQCTHVGNWNRNIDPKNVRVQGVLERDELANLMRNSHAFAHPAVNDPCPNVVLEALSCGLPVLYSNDGGTRELASGYGVSIDAGTTDALDCLLDSYADLSQRILRDTYQFSIERAADQYLDVLRSTHTGNEDKV